jgi:hypothetical protein
MVPPTFWTLNGAYPAGAAGSENDPIGPGCVESKTSRAPEWKLAAMSMSFAVVMARPL